MLSDSLFRRYQELFYRHSGIALKDYKQYLVEYRLQRFIGEGKEYRNYQELYDALASGHDRGLVREFVDTLTTNYTFFFREREHFSFLAHYLGKRAADQDYVRLWSAACSSGEEPYSMAITALKHLPDQRSDFRILATDISDRVLRLALKAEYPRDKVDGSMSRETAARYFRHDPETGTMTPKDEVRRLVTFAKLNLMDAYPFKKLFDVVFLRNVLIYFENDEKEHILDKISGSIKAGGYLVTGLAESLIGVRHSLRQLKYSIYRKGS